MEKATEIKRRAQRCFQNGDLDGALSEYEKLTLAEDSEPINLVVMADLLYKKEDLAEASRRYLQAVEAYTGAGLFKNAIAVCKKMARLSLTPAVVLRHLAELHSLDGLSTESALYYREYAEHLARERDFRGAADSLRKAFATSPENPRLLEKAADWLLQADDEKAAALLLIEASRHFARHGQSEDAARVRARAVALAPDAGNVQGEEQGGESVTAGAEARAEAPAAGPASHAVTPHAVDPVAGLEPASTFVSPAPGGELSAEDAAELVPPPSGGPRSGSPPGTPGVRPTPVTAAISGNPEMSDIEDLLNLAAERFKRGERDLAAEALVNAARGYEALDRLESAAAIYRSLGRSAHSTPEVLALWLRNCELRGESLEAAEVACGLGDCALNEGDLVDARAWFMRALKHVPDHELAARRIQKMGQGAGDAGGGGPNGSPEAAKTPDGRVEVTVGRAQAVTLDLGSLIAEFRAGIESQIADDAQSHYDLGMTYREMGLLEQAVECFRTAARDPGFRSRAAELAGRCLLDEGRFDEAAEEFERALVGIEDASDAGLGLRFQLGLAHEVAGHATAALAEFERVYAVQPNYPDVAQKIGVVRRALERV